MKHRRAISQAAKRSKVATEAKRAFMSRPSPNTRSTSGFMSHVDLTTSPPGSRGDPALVKALGDIAMAIRENTKEVKKVSTAMDSVLSFIQNRVCFPWGFLE